jgi:hypothetical protein
MKTITLLLPDTTYQRIVSQARGEGFDERHYLSNLVIEQVDSQKWPSNARNQTLKDDLTSRGQQSVPNNNALPDTVEQILAICKYMWKYNSEYGVAVRKVAADLKVHETTVRDKCTRRISLPNERISTEIFLDMLSRREPLRAYLCRRFPKHAHEIERGFNELMN